MMLVDALAQGRERRDALRGIPLRCWDARSKVSDYLDDGLPASDRVLASWASPRRAMGTRDAGVCGTSSCASASAPREPPHGSLDWAARASLRGRDPGHDGVDVHAASAPSGFSAAAATGGTTHVVLLWLTLNCRLNLNSNIPPWVLILLPGRRWVPANSSGESAHGSAGKHERIERLSRLALVVG